MQRLTTLCLMTIVTIAATSSTVLADGDDAALAILKKADAAIKAIDSVRYTASTSATGFATQFAQPAEGQVLMSGWTGSMPARFWQEVSTTPPDADGPIRLTSGGDGESFFVVDHASKKGYEDMDPNVLGSYGRALQSLAMLEFVHDAPFDDELGADVIELIGEETIGGEPCHTIRVVYAGGMGESTWSFSTRDLLPRKRVRTFSDPSRGEGSITNTITRLEVGPGLDSSLFRMSLPEGYERIDDFAP